jgi:hypothetical protein
VGEDFLHFGQADEFVHYRLAVSRRDEDVKVADGFLPSPETSCRQYLLNLGQFLEG